VSWRGRNGRHYPHVEPHPKSQLKLRDKLREKLNHWTLWRSAEEVIPEVNRLLKGWGGYFHYANSTRVFDRLNQYAASRLRTSRPLSVAHLGSLAAGTGVEAMRVNVPRKVGCGKTARPV